MPHAFYLIATLFWLTGTVFVGPALLAAHTIRIGDHVMMMVLGVAGGIPTVLIGCTAAVCATVLLGAAGIIETLRKSK